MSSLFTASCPRVNAIAFTAAMHPVCDRYTRLQAERRDSHVTRATKSPIEQWQLSGKGSQGNLIPTV